MLFPLPTELFRKFYAPVTWVLILFNYVMFLWTSHTGLPIEKSLKEIVDRPRYIQTQDWVYANYVKMHPNRYSPNMNRLADLTLERQKAGVISRLAINDVNFLKEGWQYDYPGDPVAIAEWKSQFAKFLDLREQSPVLIMGLSSYQDDFLGFVSYQFTHSGFLHFLGNIIFLFLFGVLLEPLVGGLSIIVVYLLSGFFAALFFLWGLEASMIPLVGASGSVSGLVALYSVIHWNRPVRFFYFLFLPKPEYLGYAYLPGWVILFLWVASDLAGFLSSVGDFGGVAHVAHLGGEFTGVCVGFLFWLMRRLVRRPLPGADLVSPPIGTHWSLAEVIQYQRRRTTLSKKSPPLTS